MPNPLDNLEENQIDVKQSNRKEIVAVEYTPEEKAYRENLIKELCLARDDREKPHPELDDMTYSEYYESNKKADLSYIPPKLNKGDTRIVTGITHEKDNTLVSVLLNLNLEPRITAFDETDLVISELGENVEDMVKKSREIEMYDELRPMIYRELVSQGDVFVEELWHEDYRPERTIERAPSDTANSEEHDEADNKRAWKPGDKLAGVKYVLSKEKKCFEYAETRMLTGKKVFLGNIKQPFIKNQDLVFTYEEIPRSEAEAIYGGWDRWECVPYTVDNTDVQPAIDGVYTDFSWNLGKVDKNVVGVLKIQKKFSNEYMIMLNGIMMLPVGYALTEISPSGDYTISQGKLEPIPDFAYSKSQPSKTKVDQEVLDEFLKLFIIGFRQARKPPMGNTTKKVLSSKIFEPATITPDLRPDQLFPLIKNPAVGGQGEFQIYNLIKEGIENKSVNKSFEGNAQPGDPTATQLLQEKNQQMLKLGLAIDGVINLEKSMAWKRSYTVITEYTRAIDTKVDSVNKTLEKVYRSMTIDTNLNTGTKGKKIIEFKTSNFPSEREQQVEERTLSKKYGSPVQKVYMNPQALATFKGAFYITIVPTEKNNDKLSQMLFVQNVRESIDLFGYEAHNLDYLKQRYANKIDEDPSRWYVPTSVVDMIRKNTMPNGEPMKANGGGNQQVKQNVRPKLKAMIGNQ